MAKTFEDYKAVARLGMLQSSTANKAYQAFKDSKGERGISAKQRLELSEIQRAVMAENRQDDKSSDYSNLRGFINREGLADFVELSEWHSDAGCTLKRKDGAGSALEIKPGKVATVFAALVVLRECGLARDVAKEDAPSVSIAPPISKTG